MMKTVILICAMSLPRPECSTETAISVVQGPEAGNLAQCGFVGQAYLADTALANYLDGEHYMKILCTAGDRLEVQTVPDMQAQDGAQPVQKDPIDGTVQQSGVGGRR
jgi:hypothetical protein